MGKTVEWEHVLTLLPDFELDEVEAWRENLNDKNAGKSCAADSRSER